MNEEFLRARADRINWLLERAEDIGDGAAVLGGLILTAADDDEFAQFMAGNLDILKNIEQRFIDAGIKTS